ncbi:zinc ABC transporter substrate-binding protein [uncultured Rhodospira sp.]|uniref:metal ABC transporter solute-binding protein, Zn/Mn family n=1 Tax=uncultured Rhodospira sp. TaxID=1936189 RepID=UPI002632FECD|nr:zinc ABC transporter substrate-binding protein [uncultured Rhodospira sp.]
MTFRSVHRGLLPAILALGLMSPAFADDTGHTDSPKAGPIPVMVSIIPQQWLVDSIGGDHVTTTVMVEPGASPATYEPKPSQMRAVSESEVYFTIGVPFENAWMPRIHDAAPDMRVIDMAERVKRRTMDGGYGSHEEQEHEHEHDAHADEEHHDEHHDEAAGHDGHDHSAGAPDPHVWVSPLLMRTMASTVFEALRDQRPGLAEEFRRNYATTVATINAVDADVAKDLASVPERTFMVYHPAWGYFADAYGLHQMAIEMGGNEPSPQDMHKIIDAARAHDIKVIFVQSQFSQRSAQAIAEDLGGKVRPLDPLAYDWPENTRSIGAAFAETLR